MMEKPMRSGDRIARMRALIRSAKPEERPEIAAEALRAITAEQAVEVCADWADAADRVSGAGCAQPSVNTGEGNGTGGAALAIAGTTAPAATTAKIAQTRRIDGYSFILCS